MCEYLTVSDYLESISAWIESNGKDDMKHLDFKAMAWLFLCVEDS